MEIGASYRAFSSPSDWNCPISLFAGMLVAMSADFIFAESKTQFKLPGINFGVFEAYQMH